MSPLDAASVRRRYLLLIGLRWFQSGLLIPILVLLMVSRGLSLVEIGLVGSVQGVIVLILELPTGGLSDSLGRRPTLLLAYAFAVAGLAMLYLADSVSGFVAATALTASSAPWTAGRWKRGTWTPLKPWPRTRASSPVSLRAARS